MTRMASSSVSHSTAVLLAIGFALASPAAQAPVKGDAQRGEQAYALQRLPFA